MADGDRRETEPMYREGTRIDDAYEVRALLGRGGAGTVYRVTCLEDGREVALKIPSSELIDSDRARAGFVREYRIAERLRHPKLVPVIRVADGGPGNPIYFTMALMRRGDLGSVLEQAMTLEERLPPARVIGWMVSVAEALAFIHRQGWIHQDVKPSNIFLDDQGDAVLGDFGMAFLARHGDRDQKLSRSTLVGGTAYFMAPEQYRALFYGKNEAIVPASDVCAFGLSLYNLLTGEVVVGMREHMSAFIEDGDLAEALDTFLDRCLARRPERRFADGEAMLLDLRRIQAMVDRRPRETLSLLDKLHRSVFCETREPGEVRSFFFENLEIEMVWAPPGRCRIGSPPDEPGRTGSERAFEAELTKGFWLARTQVTQAQWQAVMGEARGFFKGKQLPVEMVSFEDCLSFLEVLARSGEGLRPRLPLEVEWEYACRAGTTTAWAGPLEKLAWYDENARDRTHRVATKNPNPWNLYDMHGNVWEWCDDWFGTYPREATVNPRGPYEGESRVVRGGAWDFSAKYCRSAARHAYSPKYANMNLGFRIAMDDPT